MKIFAPKDEQNDYFINAGNLLSIPPYIIEKDFWVCWTLDHLFSGPFADVLTFKGGTSLSKGYKIIERFSEDIDLTIDKAALTLDPEKSLETPDLSQNQRKKRNKAFDNSVADFLSNEFVPWFEQLLKNEIPPSGAEETDFSLEIDPADTLNLFFHYPKVMDYPEYIKPFVRLELGARGDKSPQIIKEIKSYVEEALPEIFQDEQPISLSILAIERTFWEKATILHSVACRPGDKPVRERFSRHYYDTYQLAQDENLVQSVLKDTDLLEAVVHNKRTYFFESWDWYETAKPGSFRLVPAPERQADLKEDYQAMQSMLFSESLEFEEIIAFLQTLEDRINKMT